VKSGKSTELVANHAARLAWSVGLGLAIGISLLVSPTRRGSFSQLHSAFRIASRRGDPPRIYFSSSTFQ
jgi:hypothetical protein